MENLKKKDMFYCYSINLFHFLKASGFFYLAKGFNENTDKNYWVFQRTPEFLDTLTKWDQFKKVQ